MSAGFTLPHSRWPLHPPKLEYEKADVRLLQKDMPSLVSDSEMAVLWEEYSQEEWKAGWMIAYSIRTGGFMKWLKEKGEDGIMAIYEGSPRRTYE